MAIPLKLPTTRQLLPYLIVAGVTFGGSMWARLGDRDASCDRRIAEVDKIWQAKFDQQEAKFDRQESRIDAAYRELAKVQDEQKRTFQAYFEALAKLKKR